MSQYVGPAPVPLTEYRERIERQNRSGRSPRVRRTILGVGLIGVLVAVYLSRTYLQLAQFLSSATFGTQIANGVDSVTNTVVNNIDTVTSGFKNVITSAFLNPLQSLLASSPWYLMALVLLALSFVLGGIACAFAFVRNYFAQLNIAVKTGDVRALQPLRRSSCTCLKLERDIAAVYGSGGHVSGSQLAIEQLLLGQSGPAFAKVTAKFSTTEGSTITADGRASEVRAVRGFQYVTLVREGDHWVMDDLSTQQVTT